MNRHRELSSLVAALVQDCDSPLEKSRAVYAFLTSHSLASDSQIQEVKEFNQGKLSHAQLFTIIARLVIQVHSSSYSLILMIFYNRNMLGNISEV